MSDSLIPTFARVLAEIDEEAIHAYEHALPLLINMVNDTMCQREDLTDLIGSNATSVMQDNHANHAAFILAQFRMKSAATVLEGIIWAYQSYVNRGFSPAYFPTELTVWLQAFSHYLPEAQAKSIYTFYQLMYDSHRDFLFLSQSHTPSIQLDEELRGYFHRYLDALLEPNMHKAVVVSQEYIQTVWDIPIWWERIISPCMYEIGRLWSKGDITVGQEHMATSITQRVISLFYPLILELPRNKGVIIVAVSPAELHEIGARMVADMLEMHGWDVYYTGANTPESDLVYLIREKQARFLCISTTLSSHLIYVKHIIDTIRREETTFFSPIHVLVGGQAYMNDADLWKSVGADGFVMSASQSVQYLQALHIPKRNGNGTTKYLS
jgi:methanogenic corrinoid protein MtbC1